MFEEKLAFYIRLKWLVLAIISLTIIFESWLSHPQIIGLIALYAGLAALAATNFLIQTLAGRRLARPGPTKAALIIDLIIISLILYFGGGSENTWWFAPILYIFAAGYLFTETFTALYALLAFLLAALIFGLEFFGYLPHFNFYLAHNEAAHFGSHIIDYLTSLLTIYIMGALISNYINIRNRENVAALQAARESLEAKVRERTADLERAKKSLDESNQTVLHIMKELKANLVRLEEVDRLKTQFISSVSHELRTPMAIAREAVTQLGEGFYGELKPEQRKVLRSALANIDRQSKIVNDILDLSKIEAGKIELFKNPFDLVAATKEVIADFAPQARAKGLAVVEANLPSSLIYAKIEPMAKPIDLIMFDFDGTLADSLPAAVKSIRQMLAELGYPAKTTEEIGRHIGFGEKALVAGSIGSRDENKIKAAQAVYYKFNLENIKDVGLYPHAKETLEFFKEKIKIIISNKRDEFIHAILKSRSVDRYFREVLGGDSSACLKPDPCVINEALKKYKVQPAKALLVGDMTIDIKTGRNAGVLTCAVTYGFEPAQKLKKTRPDFLIDDLSALERLIR